MGLFIYLMLSDGSVQVFYPQWLWKYNAKFKKKKAPKSDLKEVFTLWKRRSGHGGRNGGKALQILFPLTLDRKLG